jgi:septum formation protein
MGRRFILASASPARLRVLRAAGFDPEVMVSGADEDTEPAADPEALVLTLAERKASAVAARPEAAGAIVLGCDSMLALDGQVWGKPADGGEARRAWARMRGNVGTLLTGHYLIDTDADTRVAGVAATVVRFGQPTDAEIDAYIATEEPLHVAGAFTLDGRSGPFIDGIDGDPSNVIGVSLPLVRQLLTALDVELVSLWS